MEIQNILPKDTDFEDDVKKSRPVSEIHIRIRQRNGKKTLTTIEGLADDLDLKKIAKAMRKTFQTSGAVIKTESHGEIIQFQGDQREKIKAFLVKYNIWEEPDPPIKVHGI